jgi:hypothetical protein
VAALRMIMALFSVVISSSSPGLILRLLRMAAGRTICDLLLNLDSAIVALSLVLPNSKAKFLSRQARFFGYSSLDRFKIFIRVHPEIGQLGRDQGFRKILPPR